MSQSALANKLRLLKLSPEEQAMITAHDLSERHARALLRLPPGKARLELLQLMIEKGMTVYQTEQAVEGYLARVPPKQKKKPRSSPKDVRLFINTFDKAVAAMKTAGIDAVTEKSETEGYIVCTVKIPKAV